MQSQEYGPAKWALALRSPRRITHSAIERAIDQGRILRTHVLRPTWHFVTRADIRWMLELTGPRVQRIMSNYNRKLGLGPEVMTRAAGVIERTLGDGPPLTRQELGAHLSRAGLPAKAMDLAHITMYAELEGLICSGPRRGNRFTYALLADRAAARGGLHAEEALAELTLRYFRSHGPATARDFAWWSGLTMADARRGLEMIRARSHEVDGLKYWTLDRAAPPKASRRRSVHLLPVYDEYLVAYRDHRAVPRPAYVLGSFQHALVIGGQVFGRWRTAPAQDGVALQVTAQRRLTQVERRGVAQAASDYRRFLGASVSLSIP